MSTMWVFFTALLVFWMNLGFACVETGLCRAKNAVNVLSKNLIVFACASLGFLLLGWGLMFGGDNAIIGTSHLWILTGDNSYYDDTLTSDVPFWGKFFFQLVFCGTAATIVSGAVAERVKYKSFILFSFILTLLIYPISGHWIWGGGWLSSLGFQDFAGSTAVHSVGGWAALAGALILGPRIGKYDKDGKPRAIPGHNMSLVVIGVFVLWIGWFGFNPGSTMSFDEPSDTVFILMTTNTATIAAVITSTITSWLYLGKPDLSMTANGALAGLVAITAGCAYVSVFSSLIIGALAGIIVVFSVTLFDKAHIDDPVGAPSVHMGCGLFGTLCVGLFAEAGVTTSSEVNGLFFGGGLQLLGVQALGCVAVGVWVFGAAALVWLILKKTMGIRVTPEEELAGLDISEHGVRCYPDFVMSVGTDGDYKVETLPAAEDTDVPIEYAVPVRDNTHPSADGLPKLTKVQIICKEVRLDALTNALMSIGISGMTVTHVMGCGAEKGKQDYYRGAPVETTLLPKVQVDIVVSKISPRLVIDTAKKVLYTGHIGDGKIFVYDVENVVTVRTGEEGYAALQDTDVTE